jgi:nucleoid DNA-binding protein
MSERLSTHVLAEILAERTGLELKQAEEFIEALVSYITRGIENNKIVKAFGLGVFKIVLVRERESVHIQTGKRFVIPAHHKLSFIPDKSFKEQVNRHFSSLQPVLINTEDKIPKKVVINRVVPSEQSVAEGAREISKAQKDADVRDHEMDVQDDTDMQGIYHISSMQEEFDLPLVTEEHVGSIYEQLLEKLAETTKKPIPTSASKDDDASELEFTVSEIDPLKKSIHPVVVVEDFETETDAGIGARNGTEEKAETGSEAEIDAEEQAEETISIEDDDETEKVDPMIDKTLFINVDNRNKLTTLPVWDEDMLEKKKRKFLLLWFLLLPLLIIVSVFSAAYAFLHYHRPLTEKQQAYVTYQGSPVTRENEQTPLPIGVMPTVEGKKQPDIIEQGSVIGIIEDVEHLIETIAEMPISEVGSEAGAAAKTKKEEKIDWLAPPPDSLFQKTTKQAENQNKEEVQKKDQVNAANAKITTTATETNKPENKTSSGKNIPTRVRMSQGSSLTQIAMEYYGDKIFWVYIFEHNKDQIKNFDKIPVGTELRLPSPQAYGIDAKNKASVQKARQKQSELMKWDNWDDYR